MRPFRAHSIHGDSCLVLLGAGVVLSIGWDAVGEGELVVESRQEDSRPGPEDGGVHCGRLAGEEVRPTAAGGLVVRGLADVIFGLQQSDQAVRAVSSNKGDKHCQGHDREAVCKKHGAGVVPAGI